MNCPHIRDFFFSFARPENGSTALIPVSDEAVCTFIDGSSERRYIFALVRFDAISDAPNSGENIAVYLDAEQIGEWIGAQNAARSFPAFPGGCLINEISALPSSPLAAQDEGQAKLMFQFAIDYLKEV